MREYEHRGFRSDTGETSHRPLAFFLFCCVFGYMADSSVSLGQESVLDHGRPPESVRGLSSPLDFPFVPLIPVPWLLTRFRDGVRDTLKPQLEPLPPFFRDTHLTLNTRMFYLNRDDNRPGEGDNYDEAWVSGRLARVPVRLVAGALRHRRRGLHLTETLRPARPRRDHAPAETAEGVYRPWAGVRGTQVRQL